MTTLLIDTSNQMLSIAINKNTEVRAEINVNVKVNHSETLMHYLETLFEVARVSKQDIEKIIVARGPGSYTGVRIGVTVAKVLANEWNVPLYSVSSLFSIAASAEGKVIPIIDARRNEVFAACYENGETIVEPRHMSLDEAKNLSSEAQIIGNSDEKIASNIDDFRHIQLRISSVEKTEKQLRQEDIHSFSPEYLKMSEAEVNWKNSQSDK